MSEAVVISPPVACSGEAYSGVIIRSEVAVGSISVTARFGIQNFGDSEIEQFRRAVFFDENIRRFQIAVNDFISVRRFDRFADLAENFQTIFD